MLASMNQTELVPMPTEIIVIVIVISAFCTFAGALYWGDLQTRRFGKDAERSFR